jgi:8-oxo-dGTP diphosphatase
MSAEQDTFIKEYNPKEYPPFGVAVDLCIFTIRNGAFSILLIERGDFPDKGKWALPGGFVNIDESAEDAASRELLEETGLEIFSGHLEQLKTYSKPNRDPRMRVISVAHVAFAPNIPDPVAGSDAANARWWAIEDLFTEGGPELAFDHNVIIPEAIERIRSKIEYTTLATEFLTEPFSIGELHRVYAAVWGYTPHLSNFRRKVLTTPNFVEQTVQAETAAAGSQGGRPPMLYKKGTATTLQPAMLRNTEEA